MPVTGIGRSGICRRADTCMCGPTVYSCRLAWEDHSECMLVLIGATPEGKKELIGSRLAFGKRAELARASHRCERRGLKITPEIAVGDGALGFWKALDEVFPERGTSDVGCIRLRTC